MGLLWGLLAYASQENLGAGGVTLAWLLALLYLTGTLGFDRLVGLGVGVGGGFALAWAPVVVYYGRLGRLGEFWSKVVHPNRLGRTLRPPFPARVLEVADQLFLLRVHRDGRLPALLETTDLRARRPSLLGDAAGVEAAHGPG